MTFICAIRTKHKVPTASAMGHFDSKLTIESFFLFYLILFYFFPIWSALEIMCKNKDKSLHVFAPFKHEVCFVCPFWKGDFNLKLSQRIWSGWFFSSIITSCSCFIWTSAGGFSNGLEKKKIFENIFISKQDHFDCLKLENTFHAPQTECVNANLLILFYLGPCLKVPLSHASPH